MRSSHAFGASFVFTLGANYRSSEARSDTSKSQSHVPLYTWASIEEARFPDGCRLVGVELLDDAVDLPSFRHPLRAAYILGPERGSLSEEVVARCDHIVKIPTKFCVNVAVAGAIVMYDRVKSMGRFPPRPVHEGGPVEELPPLGHGKPVQRKSVQRKPGQGH